MTLSVAQIVEELDRRAPFDRAADWDPVGLQVGDPERMVSRLAVAHEITSDVAERAAAEKFDLVVTYHPLIFRPLASVTSQPGPSGRVLALAAASVSVVAVHTSWDVAPGGGADALAAVLGIAVDNQFAELDTRGGVPACLGRVGGFSGSAEVLLEEVVKKLEVSPRVAGLAGREQVPVRVAVLPGSGGSFVDGAAAVGADVYVTGDVSHHTARRSQDLGVAIFDPGHGPTERPGMRVLYDFLSEMSDGAGLEKVVDLTGAEDDPWEKR